MIHGRGLTIFCTECIYTRRRFITYNYTFQKSNNALPNEDDFFFFKVSYSHIYIYVEVARVQHNYSGNNNSRPIDPENCSSSCFNLLTDLTVLTPKKTTQPNPHPKVPTKKKGSRIHHHQEPHDHQG
jgi:hypothetical protein